MKDEENSYASRMTLWESFGWEKYLRPDGTRDSFWFDSRRKIEIPRLVAEFVENPDFMEIPNVYKSNFLKNPEKALKDLAGMPPAVGSPFIGMTWLLDEPAQRWAERFGIDESPVNDNISNPGFAEWFRAKDSLPRVIHIDIAYSGDGDALGLAMGHIREIKEIEDEARPVIVFDFLMRIRAAPGREIILGDVRRIIYLLRDVLGFRIKFVSLDGFQSTDTVQQLRKKRFQSDYLSIDKSLLPYHDLRDAIYDQRVEWPKYMVYMEHGSTKLVDIAWQELSQLVDDGKKIDHPQNGSKDVSDAMAGVVHVLMGDRSFRRGVSLQQQRTSRADGAISVDSDLPRVPVPPNLSGLSIPGYGDPRISVPPGMRGTGDIYDGTGISRPRRQ
jgi:hypothetical protein